MLKHKSQECTFNKVVFLALLPSYNTQLKKSSFRLADLFIFTKNVQNMGNSVKYITFQIF